MRFLDETSLEHPLIQQAVATLHTRNEDMFLASQVIIEFWAVATRPQTANGLNWTPDRAQKEINDLFSLFPLLPDTPAIFTAWLELVTRYKVSGKQVHDARLAAVANAHRIDKLLTLNADDFKRFDLNAVHPEDVVI